MPNFKTIYASTAKYLRMATEGKTVEFTHGKFFGWIFTITARKEK